jgi:hypothetical protein
MTALQMRYTIVSFAYTREEKNNISVLRSGTQVLMLNTEVGG